MRPVPPRRVAYASQIQRLRPCISSSLESVLVLLISPSLLIECRLSLLLQHLYHGVQGMIPARSEERSRASAL
jgi:hypothetical protein